MSSRVDSQLEFLAVGSCFVYEPKTLTGETNTLASEDIPSPEDAAPLTSSLYRIPANREDILTSTSLSRRSKQMLTKFLRFLTSYDTPEQREAWSPYAHEPFQSFLTNHFGLPPQVQRPIKALVFPTTRADKVNTEYALGRISNHLRSMGLFGEGFGAVIPKWGGLAEIAQVGCRACAVGGGVYILGSGLDEAVDIIAKHESTADGALTRSRPSLFPVTMSDTDGEVADGPYD